MDLQVLENSVSFAIHWTKYPIVILMTSTSLAQSIALGLMFWRILVLRLYQAPALDLECSLSSDSQHSREGSPTYYKSEGE